VAKVGKSSLRVASLVALAAMIIGSLGVGNIVLAGIDARRFEFGVLRAVGASPGVLGRLVVGEVLLLCVAAGVLGTLMGIQASYAAVRLYRLMAGLDVHLVPAYNAIALGWVLLFVIALVMTAPLIIRLMRAQVRELLAATRG
jgi:putative ABC transport system permease protein